MTYSQGREEAFINLLEGHGRYLDIGSFDGRTFSNTRALAERGWEGVCVEPAAPAFAAMLSDPPPNATLVNALVGPRTGLASFLSTPDAVSTTERAHAQKWKRYASFTPVFTVSVSVDDLLAEFPGPYRFVSIDTESTSLKVLEWLRPHLETLGTEMVCIEHDGHNIAIPGFLQLFRNAENVILRRR